MKLWDISPYLYSVNKIGIDEGSQRLVKHLVLTPLLALFIIQTPLTMLFLTYVYVDYIWVYDAL